MEVHVDAAIEAELKKRPGIEILHAGDASVK